MPTSIRWRPASMLAGIVLTACLVAGSAVPAQASATAFATTWQGTGAIAPGVDVAGVHTDSYNFTSVTITSTGIVNGAPVVLSPSSCTWAGSSIIAETYAIGIGNGVWNCSSGALAGRAGGLVYVRAGAVEVIVFTGGLTGPLGCLFQPDTLPPAPIRSYHLTCTGALASTS